MYTTVRCQEIMFIFGDNIPAFLALAWAWTMAHHTIIIVGLLAVALLLPVACLAAKTLARAFCRHNDTHGSNVLPVALTHDGKIKIADTDLGGAAPSIEYRSGMKVLEEVRPVHMLFANSGCLLAENSI